MNKRNRHDRELRSIVKHSNLHTGCWNIEPKEFIDLLYKKNQERRNVLHFVNNHIKFSINSGRRHLLKYNVVVN